MADHNALPLVILAEKFASLPGIGMKSAQRLAYHVMSMDEAAVESFPLDARLPWDHTSPGVNKGFLQREWRRAIEGVTTPDCTMTSCTGCGVCHTLGVSNVIAGDRHAR